MTDVIDQALGNLQYIKEQQEEERQSDDSGEAEQYDEDACYNCGSKKIGREVTSADGANSTKNRLVGGQNMRVKRVCRECDNWWYR